MGNIREVWRAAGIPPSGTVQYTQYYPSCLPWVSNYGDGPGTQPYKYNGKEFVEMHGYDTYDYGARGMYPAIGRFSTVDPLAEKYYSISPYAYCKNDPVNYIDPNGEFSTKFGAWLNKIFTGGGSDIEKNRFGQYYYTRPTKGEAGVTAEYGSNGVKGKPDQINGASIFGTASSQLLKLGTSIYHEASIDMKEASNEAIDFWAKILKNNSATTNQNENSQNNKPKVISTVLTGFGIVEDVYDDGSVTLERVIIRKEDGTLVKFNARKNQFHKKDTFNTWNRVKYSNGKYETIYKNFYK